MRGEARAILHARVLRLNPARRVATVALKPVGRGQAYDGAYVSPTDRLADVVDRWTPRTLGRLTKVNPVAGGAEIDLVIGDDATWQSLAAGTAAVDVTVAFTSSIGGDPVGGRVQRIEIS